MMKTKQAAPFPLRMPPELKEWITALAETNLRSVNAEIVSILLADKKRQEKRALKKNLK
jgi:hypothetical protein